MTSSILSAFDRFFPGGETPAAAVQWSRKLRPVDMEFPIVFPPTHAPADSKKPNADDSAYVIDELPGGHNLCSLDSVGSQANRMEPIFAEEPYRRLIPQVVVAVGYKDVNLVHMPHRAADAIVRHCTGDLRGLLETAWADYAKGDAWAMAKIAPTSLVFGAWDSRGSRAKIARMLSGQIMAADVTELRRKAQYSPAVDVEAAGLFDGLTDAQKKTWKSDGFGHVPCGTLPGGVCVNGVIIRSLQVQVAALRAVVSTTLEKTLKLRRYVFGLALVAATADSSLLLRQGCNLVYDADSKPQPGFVLLVAGDVAGPVELTAAWSLKYAEAAAADFGVGDDLSAVLHPRKGKAPKSKDDA